MSVIDADIQARTSWPAEIEQQICERGETPQHIMDYSHCWPAWRTTEIYQWSDGDRFGIDEEDETGPHLVTADAYLLGARLRDVLSHNPIATADTSR